MKINTNDESTYTIKTNNGKMYIKPSDIMQALEEQANTTNEDITPPEEDLSGWGVVYATDENGKSRPAFLMRVLPAMSQPQAYYKVAQDDKNMQDIILRKIYNLTPSRIKWIRFKKYIKDSIKKLIKK